MVASSNTDTRPLSPRPWPWQQHCSGAGCPCQAVPGMWSHLGLHSIQRVSVARGMGWPTQGTRWQSWTPWDCLLQRCPLSYFAGKVTLGGWIWASAPGGAWPPAATQQHALCSQGQARSLAPQRLTVTALLQVIWVLAADKMKQLKQAGWLHGP